MAIFGDLQHHAFTDVAKVIKKQTGTLFLHSAYQHQTVEMVLQRDQVQGLFIDGFPVTQESKLKDVLFYLVTHSEGRFEFEEAPLQLGFRPSLHAPLSELLQQVVAEANVPEDQLPHGDTRFVIDAAGLSVPASLAERWTRMRPLMQRGSSAAELSRQLPYSEREMRVSLHQLRAVGLIAPQRAGSRHAGAGAVSAGADIGQAPAPAPQPLVHRLMNALRRMTGTVRS